MSFRNKIEDLFIGLSLADALGVPYEFRSRSAMKTNPANTMIGYGTYNQPPGTWSDDSSLTFCLAESLLEGYNLLGIGSKFIEWKNEQIWTPFGEVFDIGIQTSKSINSLRDLISQNDLEGIKTLKYSTNEYTNGNGALMRILPLLFYIKGKNISTQFDIIRDVAALTHPHIRSAIACLIYLKLAEFILIGNEIREAYHLTKKEIRTFFIEHKIAEREVKWFDRIINDDISLLTESEIQSSGYVIHTLEASFWCLLNSKSYEESVFKAINLGEDTDTTACVVGGIAGLYFGLENIPDEWFNKLARIDSIKDLAKKFHEKYQEKITIKLIKGDITKIEVDVIVNAANTSLLGGGGVDGAIHRAGGKSILEDCQEIRNKQGGCAVGKAVITAAGNLKAKNVIHTVGPVWNKGSKSEEIKLRQCYRNSLELAFENDLKSIAFPCISTGIYKFPKSLAAKIAVETVKEYSKINEVTFVCYDDVNYQFYKELLNL